MKAVSSIALALALPAIGMAQDLTPKTAWSEFLKTNEGVWQVVWNDATGTPKAIYGPGLKLGAAVESLEKAQSASDKLLSDHAKLLGKGQSEFVLNIGTKAGRVYIFVYDQQFRGLDVISGRADVRVHEVGAISMFGSSAIQIPANFNTTATFASVAAEAVAAGKILESGRPNQGNGQPTRLVIWADTTADNPTNPTLAWEVQIFSPIPKGATKGNAMAGKAYIDAATGAFLEYKDEILYCGCISLSARPGATKHNARMHRALDRVAKLAAKENAAKNSAPKMALTGKVMAWANASSNAGAASSNVALPRLRVTSSAGTTFTDANGEFSIPYSGTTPVTVFATLEGMHLRRVRTDTGSQLTASAVVTPGTAATIQFGTASINEFDRAQTTTYLFTDDVNVWIRSLLPGSASRIDTISRVNPRVNIPQNCNAFYGGNTINFYTSGGGCANTAFESVVQHEWGHGIDDVFGGVSQTDGLSEGWGDILCIYRSNQPEVGPGFQIGSTRGIRSGLNTRTYPQAGSVHTQGQTWMGFAWDLRNNLIATLGRTAGVARAEEIVVASVAANARNQPDAVREVFILDDDDGNLNNGTPNYADLVKAAQKRTLPFPFASTPDSGSYLTYGEGCTGSGTVPCPSANANGGSLTNASRNNEYAYIVDSARAGVLNAFEVYTRSNTGGNVTIVTAVYADNGGEPAASPLVTGTMTVTPTAGFHKTTLTTPVPAGRYYIALRHNNTAIVSQLSSGDLNGAYWRRTGAWSQSALVTRASYKVTCVSSGGASPVLSATGIPDINRSFTLSLARANASSAGFLIIGASDSMWSGNTLPLDLTSAGATGCNLLASLSILVGINTNGTGGFSQSFTVPNDPTLVKSKFFNQFAVADGANTLGVVLSNGGVGTIGKQ